MTVIPLEPDLSGLETLEEVPGDLYDLQDSPEYLNETETLQGTNVSGAEEYYEFQGIRELELDLSLCQLSICQHEQDFISVEAANVLNYFHCSQDGGTLVLKDDRPADTRQNSMDHALRLTLYLPEQTCRKVSVEMGAGEITLDSLTADEVEIDNGVGNITIGTLKGSDLSIDTGVGEFLADLIQTDGEADINVGTGNVILSQFDGNSLELECGVGNAEVTVTGSESDYNYTLDAGLGSICLNNQTQNSHEHPDDSHDGWGSHMNIHNGADRRISIDCGLGNASLNFMEE